MRTFLLLSFLAWLTIGCEKQRADDETTVCVLPQNGKITLALNNCAESDSAGIASKFCFEKLEDSRCPANVVCVWSGVAIAKFSFNANGSQHQFSLSTLKSFAFPPNDTLIAGYRIKLLEVTPYPGTGSTDPTRVVLGISR